MPRINKSVTVGQVEKRWLSSQEARKYLGMGKDFFDNLRENAKIHYYKVGNSIFYAISDLDNLILKNKVI